MGLWRDHHHWRRHGAAKVRARLRAKMDALHTTYKFSDDAAKASAERTIPVQLTAPWSAATLALVVPPDQGWVYLIFFDGGSRGNPGPGGSGSVVVRLGSDGTKRVVWCASMSYARRNNVAEYWGLVHGLQYAEREGIRPIHVVGDSRLILMQVSTHQRLRAPHLQALYSRVRRSTTAVGVASWTHHLREHNKMADAAANAAMDDKTSIHTERVRERATLCHILDHLEGDVAR